MSDWKQLHANEAQKAIDHELVREIIEEQFDNLVRCCGIRADDGLVRYGLRKIATYAAQVARAHALGFDPNLLRLSDEESDQDQLKIAKALVAAGKPVFLVVPPTREPGA